MVGNGALLCCLEVDADSLSMEATHDNARCFHFFALRPQQLLLDSTLDDEAVDDNASPLPNPMAAIHALEINLGIPAHVRKMTMLPPVKLRPCPPAFVVTRRTSSRLWRALNSLTVASHLFRTHAAVDAPKTNVAQKRLAFC